MPRKRKVKVSCPTCKKPVLSSAEDFPFCNERCRLLDLGKWASGQHVISSPVHDISDAMENQSSPRDHDED